MKFHVPLPSYVYLADPRTDVDPGRCSSRAGMRKMPMETSVCKNAGDNSRARIFRRAFVTIVVAVLLVVLTLTQAGKIHAAAAVLLGDQTVEATTDSINAGSAEAFQT